MKVQIIEVHGITSALHGLGLSHGITSGLAVGEADYSRPMAVAKRLAGRGGGHDKFLRQIVAWLDITAPAYWWPELDQYKVATVTQSESKMHTLLKNPITQECFERPIHPTFLGFLESQRKAKNFSGLLNALPHGWLQRRILSCSAATLRNIIEQRRGHKLPEWGVFIDSVVACDELKPFMGVE